MVDGDKSLVVSDKTLISVAERNIKKYDIVPLYYNMKKAEPSILNNETIYNGLNTAFIGSNIGQYSNNITKIWNSEIFISGTDDEKKKALYVIKLLCMENNYCIDRAKTLYMPKRPGYIKKLITSFTNEKVPYFFKYAKDKSKNQVAKINNSFVNKLNNIIPNPRLNYNNLDIGEIDYKLLMNNSNIKFNVEFSENGKLIKEGTNPLIIRYHELNKKYFISLDRVLKMDYKLSPEVLTNSQLRQNIKYNNLIKEFKYELSQFGYSDIEITDILVKYLYDIKKSKNKSILWLCYGNYIYENLSNHLKSHTKNIQCIDCGEWINVPIKDNKTCRCSECNIEHKRELTRLRVKKYRNKVM